MDKIQIVQIELKDDNKKMWSDMWLRRREKESQKGRREESLGWVVLYLFFLILRGGLGAAESLGRSWTFSPSTLWF